jgi:phosphoglycolate phosphatase
MGTAMADFPFDLVAFDLDGTLADTAPDIAAALNLMLGEFGRPALDPALIRTLIGGGAKTLIRKALETSGGATDALVEQAYPVYLDRYGANICDGTACYPAVEQAMDDLAALRVRLAICTNKPERLTHQLLDALRWGGRFAAIVAGDSFPYRKPDPRLLRETIARAGGGRAAYVGDSTVDAETAKAAGIPFVAVSFGFSDRPASEFGADAVIDDYADLIAALRSLA